MMGARTSMTTATLTITLTDLLSRFATRGSAHLRQSAARFATLVGAPCELENERPVGSALTAATLRITSGLHRGATLDLTALEYTIGTGEDCDIVLRDPSLAPRHCRLKREWRGFTLQDLRNDASGLIAPQTIDHQGDAIEIAYDIGGVVIALTQRTAPHASVSGQEQNSRHQPRLAVWGVLTAGLVLAIVALAATRGATQPRRPAAGPIAPSAAIDPQLLEQVKHTFASDNLDVALHDGRLRIAGNTERLDEKSRIRSLAEDLRGVIAVEDGVTYMDAHQQPAAPGPFPLKLRGVMIGNASYFVTDRGARYFVGGVLPDGAEVLAIESTQIRLQVGGRTVIYSLE
jgi:hypothetical protein